MWSYIQCGKSFNLWIVKKKILNKNQHSYCERLHERKSTMTKNEDCMKLYRGLCKWNKENSSLNKYT